MKSLQEGLFFLKRLDSWFFTNLQWLNYDTRDSVHVRGNVQLALKTWNEDKTAAYGLIRALFMVDLHSTGYFFLSVAYIFVSRFCCHSYSKLIWYHCHLPGLHSKPELKSAKTQHKSKELLPTTHLQSIHWCPSSLDVSDSECLPDAGWKGWLI